jgi:DUF1009 family protein
MRRIALVAGKGRLPSIFADEARKNGDFVVGVAVNGLTSPELEGHVDRIHWGEITEPAKALDIFRQEKVDSIVMTGKMPKAIIFNRKFNLDKEAAGVLKNTVDRKDYTIIKAIASRLRKEGISLIDPMPYLKGLIPRKGPIAKRLPTANEMADVRFGYKTAKRMAGMDIGQAVCVRNKMVVAVEAHEGTDNMIRRAGSLDGAGSVIVKVARPRQDMRFDVPTIGPETIDSVIAAKAKVLAVEAGKTLVVNRDRLAELADTSDISVLAV